MNAGIWKGQDLFDSKGNVIPFNFIVKRGVAKSKYILWQGIVTAIKRLKVNNKLTKMDNDSVKEIKLPTNDIIQLCNSTSKDNYHKLVKLAYEIPPAIHKYKITFPELHRIDLENIYLIPRISTSNNCIKELQFQILHRYLPTNFLLYKMNKVPSMGCSFCEVHTESIPHIFYYCIHVKPIWNNICNVLEKLYSRKLAFRCQDVIFGLGFEHKLKKEHVTINNVILNVKAFIWDVRKHNGVVRTEGLVNWFDTATLLDKSLLEFSRELRNLVYL